MKVKVSGRVLYDAMSAKVARMQPRMDELNRQQSAYESYITLKRSMPWYKRCTVWRNSVDDPFGPGLHDPQVGNIFFRIRYDELASAIRHMDIDATHDINSLDFYKYGLEV